LRLSAIFVLSLFESVFSFVGEWFVSRPWFSLLLGVPALATGFAFLAVEPWHSFTSREQWADRYGRAGQMALGRGDLQAAAVYFRRLASLDMNSPAASYGMALTAERQGNIPLARSWMLRIAPETELGHPPAHFWLATDMMRRGSPLGVEDARILEHHLAQALRSPAHEPMARVHLARLHMLRGETIEAIRETERVVTRSPSLLLNLARLYAQAGRLGEARRAAIRASEYFEARTLAEPAEPLNRLSWATSLVMQERYEDARNVLTLGLSWPEPEPFHKALSGLYMHWLVATAMVDTPDLEQQLEFLSHALRHDDSNALALVMVCNLALGESPVAERAAKLLNEIPASGLAPDVVHLALGTRALHRGDRELALTHLKQAQQSNPRISAILNNLAWDLAHHDEPNLDLAVQFAEAAVQLFEHPEFRDTFGTILAKLGRAEQAVEQLEIALQGLPPRAEIHEKLGDLYQQLGRADLAAEHHRQAAELQTSRVPSESE
jgi:tetratricopeptide (TPR) repeat protein